MTGTVYLVGAGPGDPELITVRGLRVLRQAQVVVYDRLVHPALLDEAPRAAERVFVGKHPGGPRTSQDEVCALLVDRARRGARVVRLKGGDPFVFGRGGEEAEALLRAGVPFEVVPGVTAAVAVPAAAGIPVTHRDCASGFAVVTGHQCDEAPGLDWQALARMPTLVVLMGLRRLASIARCLVEHGMSPSTPVAVIAQGTLPGQRCVTGDLTTIARRVEDAGLEPPATIVVGPVVRLRSPLVTPEPPVPVREVASGGGAP